MTDTLLIKINATTETLKAELKEARDTVAGFAQKVGVDLKTVDAHFARLNTGVSKTGALMAGAVGGGVALFTAKLAELPSVLIDVARHALEYAAGLKDTAAQLGVSTTFLQQFRNAALANGATLVGADAALGKFSTSLGNAFSGESKAAVAAVTSALKGTGVTLGELAKQTDTDRFLSIADGLARIKDPAQQSAAALKVFGQGYKQVLPLLQEGRAGFKAATDEAARFGVVLSEGQIAHADETASKIEALNRALQTRIAGVVADNATAIGLLADKLATLAGWAVQAGTRFIGFANIVQSRGFVGALMATTGSGNGARLEHAATPRGATEEAFRGWQQADREYKALGQTAANWHAGVDPETRRVAREKLGAATRRYWDARGNEQRVSAPIGPAIPATITPPASGKGRSSGGGSATPVDRFASDLARAQGDMLQAQLGLAVDAGERARIQHALLDSDTREANARVADSKNLSAAEKARLTAINAQVAQARGDVIDRQRDETLAQQSLDVRLGDVANERTLLQGSAALARTAAERRLAELRLLDLQIQEEGARQDAIIASSSSTEAEKEIARRRIAQLPHEKAQAVIQIARGTQSPLESFLDGIPDTAARVNESLEAIAATGLQSLNDGITDAIVNGKSLGATFKAIANQIIADLIRIAVQQSITGPLATSLLGGATGGGLLSGLGGLFGKRASGGPVTAGQPYLVGERGPELIVPRLSGSVIANSNLRGASGGSMRVEIVDTTGLFETRVTQISAPLAARAGQAATLQGADLAGARAAVQSSRRLA